MQKIKDFWKRLITKRYKMSVDLGAEDGDRPVLIKYDCQTRKIIKIYDKTD